MLDWCACCCESCPVKWLAWLIGTAALKRSTSSPWPSFTSWLVLGTDARCSAAGSLCRRNGHCRHGEDHARPQGHGTGTSLVGLQGMKLVAAVVASC